MRYNLLTLGAMLSLLCSCNPSSAPASAPEKEAEKPLIVFVTGDEEYRSEESMPMLARLVERELGARTQVLFALDSAGFVNPNVNDNIEGLEALDDADMMVLFTRWRALPDAQAQHILDFAESGKPMAGFRTSTHAFMYKDDSLRQHLNNDWPTAVFGQQWITHHGHFDDGHDPLTAVSLVEEAHSPILNGIQPFDAYSWLYHVDGGEWKINPKTKQLLRGKSLRSKHEEAGRLDQFPLNNPVAWTNDYKGARVFFTTLGHPYDWQNENMRRLALNGIAWALDRADDIPAEGFNPTIIGSYQPNNSGFGEKFKKGLRPEELFKENGLPR
ncbi:ThuA domain-containing protein [Neolewinella agarilytica]|uniref:Type 1 glutamine amidotransferase (GATase1) n=1 Tax=Neolewinella agarilytica TaxID=478744 RepID=A0A1H9GA65_9BACT|nr:ThuA domain-containing protein [Neolewinella agarilytica]SEQ46950.1 Type 1 glutamine amidotransferase (GATase1) [Neolewinella agarilytica]